MLFGRRQQRIRGATSRRVTSDTPIWRAAPVRQPPIRPERLVTCVVRALVRLAADGVVLGRRKEHDVRLRFKSSRKL